MIWEQRVPTIVMLTRIFEGRVRKISKVSCVVGMMWLKLSTSWLLVLYLQVYSEIIN